MISLVNINKSAKIAYLFTFTKKMLNGKLNCIVHYTWEGNLHDILQTDTWVHKVIQSPVHRVFQILSF